MSNDLNSHQAVGEDRFTPEERAEMDRAAKVVSKLAFRQLHREAERGGRIGMFYAGVMCGVVGHIAAHLGPEIALQLFRETYSALCGESEGNEAAAANLRAALHHLQSDGAIDRQQLAVILRGTLEIITGEPDARH